MAIAGTLLQFFLTASPPLFAPLYQNIKYIKLYLGGILSLDDDNVNETWLSTVKHIVWLAAVYTF